MTPQTFTVAVFLLIILLAAGCITFGALWADRGEDITHLKKQLNYAEDDARRTTRELIDAHGRLAVARAQLAAANAALDLGQTVDQILHDAYGEAS